MPIRAPPVLSPSKSIAVFLLSSIASGSRLLRLCAAIILRIRMLRRDMQHRGGLIRHNTVVHPPPQKHMQNAWHKYLAPRKAAYQRPRPGCGTTLLAAAKRDSGVPCVLDLPSSGAPACSRGFTARRCRGVTRRGALARSRSSKCRAPRTSLLPSTSSHCGRLFQVGK
jgi:hypothetical protein